MLAILRSGGRIRWTHAILLVKSTPDFATIAVAVREGRKLHANLRKAVAFYLAAKLALVLSSLVAVLVRAPLPFAPIQLILMELFMDVFASITFTAEPAEGDLMRLPPRGLRRRFLDRGLASRIASGGLALGAAVAVSYLATWMASHDEQVAQTSAFVAWMIGQTALALMMRTERQFPNPVANKPYVIWAVASIGVIVASQALPPVTELLHAAVLDQRSLLVAVVPGVLSPLALTLLRIGQRKVGGVGAERAH